ncbi:hypothetical protein K8R03_03235 [Candidatus Kaiserbacteria bacterium]|nr:hypothetical protein [Candidatus Kaiserbacteria bacterium]
MKHLDLRTLQAAAVPLPASMGKRELLTAVAQVIRSIGPATFKSLVNVEGSLSALRATSVTGTPIEPIAEALAAGGRDPGTTVGTVMDAMNFTQSDVNSLACYCANGDTMTAERAAANLDALAAKC